MRFKPHNYQQSAEKHAIDVPKCGLVLDMGLGKTVITLTVLDKLLCWMEIKKPLIIAPKLVTEQTWTAERDKWDHLRHLKISRIIGSQQERILALNTKADIYIVSRDNIAWLVAYCGHKKFPFDAMVLDEWSSFKSRTSNRFKAVVKVLGLMERVIALTGTPAPNGLMDLWAQLYLLDKGERLEKNIGGYRQRYFQTINIDQYNKQYVLREGSEAYIYDKIKDICISMEAKDWLDLEPRIDQVQRMKLPNMKAYKDFEKEKFLELGEQVITPVNAPGLYNKLLQFCNGAVYDDDRNYHVVSDAKLDLLEENIEALNGKPVIVFYQFKSDIARIQARIKNVVRLTSAKQIEDWNAGKIQILLAHAASTGHGLNLQHGGHHIIWFGLPWSLELYMQAVARLDRQGQKEAVINIHLITEGTVEEIVWKRLQTKGLTQQDLIDALKMYVGIAA
jgi:SNF2 family DNA or RNA helicase